MDCCSWKTFFRLVKFLKIIYILFHKIRNFHPVVFIWKIMFRYKIVFVNVKKTDNKCRYIVLFLNYTDHKGKNITNTNNLTSLLSSTQNHFRLK